MNYLRSRRIWDEQLSEIVKLRESLTDAQNKEQELEGEKSEADMKIAEV